jgi:hypothetical protein
MVRPRMTRNSAVSSVSCLHYPRTLCIKVDPKRPRCRSRTSCRGFTLLAQHRVGIVPRDGPGASGRRHTSSHNVCATLEAALRTHLRPPPAGAAVPLIGINDADAHGAVGGCRCRQPGTGRRCGTARLFWRRERECGCPSVRPSLCPASICLLAGALRRARLVPASRPQAPSILPLAGTGRALYPDSVRGVSSIAPACPTRHPARVPPARLRLRPAPLDIRPPLVDQRLSCDPWRGSGRAGRGCRADGNHPSRPFCVTADPTGVLSRAASQTSSVSPSPGFSL